MIQPEVAVPSATESFESFDLLPVLMRGLSDAGFTKPTAIQSRALPVALEGHDLMASAQTGTGKTAAFVLPALQRLLNNPPGPGRGPRVLVLTPTRELATQVSEVIAALGRHANLRSGSIVGGMSYGPQENLLRKGVDLLVATPGRLIDHMGAGLLDWSRLELLVLDEADRMLDMGFIKPVQRIAGALPADRQTLLFSATLEGEVLSVARKLLRNPRTVALSHNNKRHESITQRLHVVEGPTQKHVVLARLLADPALTQAIVFTATKRGADRLAKRLSSAGHLTAALHGNMRQTARRKTVDLLRAGKVNILVATDVAARGIDLEGVTHVINFDLPTVAEDYIHRIGRTGRNGAEGTAVSIVGPDDRVKLGMIEKLTGQRLVRFHMDTLPPAANEDQLATAPAGGSREGGRSGSRRESRGPGPQARTVLVDVADLPRDPAQRRSPGPRRQRPQRTTEAGAAKRDHGTAGQKKGAQRAPARPAVTESRAAAAGEGAQAAAPANFSVGRNRRRSGWSGRW